jgi:hypothetical protein
MKRQAQGRTRLSRIAVAVGAVALVGVGAAACAAKVDQPKDEAAAQELDAQRQHRFKSPVTVVIDAARLHGDLTAEQEQTIDEIDFELEGNRERWIALRDKLRASAANIVRAGSARSEEFNQAFGEAVRAMEEHAQESTVAIEEIHAILEPEQRAAVGDALRAYIDEKFGPKPEREREKRRRDGFQRFAAHLMLSNWQIDKLMEARKELIGEKRDLRPSKEELYALVDAFEGEEFSAAVTEFHAKKSRLLRARMARAGERTDTVLSIFTPEQRDLLAELIVEGPSKVLLGEEAPQE